jgi:anaerobic selenocysteine-containing dehydrogenase
MVKRPGSRHYEPISWDEAFALIADELRQLDSPDEAVFYTSGRTSNEAAFLYQLLVRSSAPTTCPTARTCATSRAERRAHGDRSASARARSARGLREADLILVVGPEPRHEPPADAHRRSRAAKAQRREDRRVNPLPEAGLLRFKNPQKSAGCSAVRHPARDALPPGPKIGGDQALFKG